MSTFLAPFLVLHLAFLPKSLLHILCSGAYLVYFLFKFVSRRLALIHRRPNLLYCSDIYHLAFLKESPTRKILVYAVYVAELVQTILFSQMAFKEFGTGFGSFGGLDKVGSFWFSIPVLSTIGMSSWSLFFRFLTSKLVEFAVQIFYAHKIKLLAKSNFIAAVVVLVKISFFAASGIVLF